MCVVVLCNDIQEAVVDRRLIAIEFVDVGMLKPIDNHFASQDDEERTNHLTRSSHNWNDLEALW